MSAPAAAAATIALFPLGTVLFPGGPLQLRIFETRYTDLVRRCMREDAPFGVVLILAGAEVGELASTAAVGTTARIVDFSRLPDGLLGISCLGERRFRVLERSRQADGLNLARVEWLAPEPGLAVPAQYRHLAVLLERLIPELGAGYAAVPKRYDDAAWVGSRLLEILPLDPADKQSALEMDDPLGRLERIAPLIRRQDD